MPNNLNVKEIALFMMDKLKKESVLYQNEIAFILHEKYSELATYININGNLAINKDILVEFKKISKRMVVWDKSEKCWRIRKSYDPINKRAID